MLLQKEKTKPLLIKLTSYVIRETNKTTTMNTKLCSLALILILATAGLFHACTKSEVDCNDCINMTIRDFEGLDGCKWVLELNDGTRLEPTNLEAFNVEIKDGKKVCVKYAPRTDLMSICMVGEAVDIIELNCEASGV